MVIKWSIRSYSIESHKIWRIPYENASRRGLGNLCIVLPHPPFWTIPLNGRGGFKLKWNEASKSEIYGLDLPRIEQATYLMKPLIKMVEVTLRTEVDYSMFVLHYYRGAGSHGKRIWKGDWNYHTSKPEAYQSIQSHLFMNVLIMVC